MPTPLRRVIAVLMAILAAAVAGTWGAGAAAAGTLRAQDDEIIGGITVSAAVVDLQDDGVAVISSSVPVSALAPIVADARSKDLQFGVLVTDIAMSQQDCNDLAGALSSATGLTVLVLSDRAGKGASSTLSSSVLADAEQAASAYRTDDVAAARAFVAAATATTQSSMPWLLIGAVVLVVALAGLGVLWGRRRARARAGDHLEELAAGLQQRSSAVAGQILGLSDRVDVLGRPDLEARFDAASADYGRLQETLGAAVTDRAAVNSAAAALSDLERRLDQLDREVDVLAPGIEPPSPTG